MKAVVTVTGPDGVMHKLAVLEDGEEATVSVPSPYLVSAGQAIEIKVGIHDYAVLVGDYDLPVALGVVQIDRVHDYSMVPSRRTLADILMDAVSHSVRYPGHGIDCVCMDSFIREVRVHTLRPLARFKTQETYQNTDEWESQYDARARIRHILRVASGSL